MFRVCSSCNAEDALLKCPCLASYYCNLACQQAHWIEHKCKCTEHLLKCITKKRSGIDALQAGQQGSSTTSVELMALEQELAQEHRTRAGLLIEKFESEHYDVADHYKEAMILHRAVQTSLSMLSGAAARSAARKLAHKASGVGLFETVIDL